MSLVDPNIWNIMPYSYLLSSSNCLTESCNLGPLIFSAFSRENLGTNYFYNIKVLFVDVNHIAVTMHSILTFVPRVVNVTNSEASLLEIPKNFLMYIHYKM